MSWRAVKLSESVSTQGMARATLSTADGRPGGRVRHRKTRCTAAGAGRHLLGASRRRRAATQADEGANIARGWFATAADPALRCCFRLLARPAGGARGARLSGGWRGIAGPSKAVAKFRCRPATGPARRGVESLGV